MKATGLLVLFSFFYMMAGAQQPYWQQRVDYTITVSLNDADHTLDGHETMQYFNNSDDSLHFIWVHVWMNAYKNDRTAFTDQQLENGNTGFYFSRPEDRGYINRLAFKVNGSIATIEDHPQHQDIIKLNLPAPLAPHQHCTIETPFHVKLPYNFSRGGHVGQSYQITQWYPKAAVYDKKGWHEMPYLDEGEFYSDFGNYEVTITLPKKYIVAATGERIKEDSNQTARTVVYKQNDVIDFAWFADKNFIVHKDTLALPSGKVISVAAYSLPAKQDTWKNALQYIKKSALTRSRLIGEYPYKTIAVVQANLTYAGGMEYPTITVLSGIPGARSLESVIDHEVGHNWFYGILASNEREHAWMDEGMNTYYNNYRYTPDPIPANTKKEKKNFVQGRMPGNVRELQLRYAIAENKDQPVETSSEDFSETNYNSTVYYKAGKWMQSLEHSLGRKLFDSCMQAYYSQWKFRHPYPEDFNAVVENVSNRSNSSFSLLSQKGALEKTNAGRKIKLASFFSLKDTDKYKYIFVLPAVGYNMYDKAMIGIALHNYTLPPEKFQFFLSPLYATGSKQVNGIGTLNYHWLPKNGLQKIEIGINGSRFSSNHSLDTTGKKIFENFSKIVPYARLYFRHGYRSSIGSFIDVRTYILNERHFDNFDYAIGSDSAFTYPKSFSKNTRYVNQATFTVENSRVLYPYDYQLQVQQGNGFYRINATGHYFFNYAKGGGMQVRLFAAKFGYIGEKKIEAFLYQPKLLAGNGTDDYTNSNYFIGRTASTAYGDIPVKNEGLAAQQVMIQNTGGLTLRLDPYSSVQGYSENWMAAINLNTTLPEKLFPVKLPLKIFFDAGSYAEAWGKNASTPKFLYVGGLQLSLFKDVLNIYAPLIYSTAFKDQLKTDSEANKFFKKITFSIEFQKLNLKTLLPQLAL